jgi:hypothetical protein
MTRTQLTDRQSRIDSIRDAAITCRALGQAATHRRAPDGRHEVAMFDRAAGRLRVYRGKTLAEALDRAKRREEAST